MAGVSATENEKYSKLEDFKVDVNVEDESFCLCFWVYLLNSTTFPCTFIRQVHVGMGFSAPFIVIDENKKMMLLPVTLFHKEAPDPVDTSSWTEAPNVSTNSEFSIEKWVHVLCEVTRNYIRLILDGVLVGEQNLTPFLIKNLNPECSRKISLFSVGGAGCSVRGFIKCPQVLPSLDRVELHYLTDPPICLLVEKSFSSGIDVDNDGVWKVSCREMFTVDAVLYNAIGQHIHMDVEVVASLLYADTGTRVEAMMSEAKAPLLIICEGVGFAADDKTIKLFNGRASFELKISQLSSMSDNRMFCIQFEIPNAKDFRFLKAYTNTICCVSSSPKTVIHIDDDLSTESLDAEQCKLGNENGVNMHRGENDSSNDLEKPEITRHTISDATMFRYNLANLIEKSVILKDITSNSSEDEVSDFANQVTLFSGCSHHSYQINMARNLIAEASNVWTIISRNNEHVLWDKAVCEIEEHFMRISKCNTRSLTNQDFHILKKIAGCYTEYIIKENFEKMWCWLFPVAFSISRGLINGIWCALTPKWIEGFITMEEAEHSLQGQEPGTFILRFPVSRSWPHPDAGSLVVTYVDCKSAIRHRQLNIDDICESSEGDMDAKPLQDVLLAEPELSQLGRVIRSP